MLAKKHGRGGQSALRFARLRLLFSLLLRRLEQLGELRNALNTLCSTGAWLAYSDDGLKPPKAPNPAAGCATMNDVRRPTLDPVFVAQGDALQPDVPKILGGLPENVPRNRVGLAKWLTSRENPLVARVLVNRIWQHVFGAGLVRTPEDFGRQGQQPSHPELLEYLAAQLRENESIKQLHRLIVTSATYRQTSKAEPSLAAAAEPVDAENHFYWRMNRRLTLIHI